MIFIPRRTICSPFTASAFQFTWWLATAFLFHFSAHIEAASINKCVVDGNVTYQDTPCDKQETAEQWAAREKHYESLYKKLDQLASQGYGIVQRPAPKQPTEPIPPKQSEYYIAQPKPSYAQRLARDHEIGLKLQARTEQSNAESAAWLDRILSEMKTKCGRKFAKYPAIGMNDADFRNCTIHAHFGGLTQVVVSKDENIPLRLYVFPSEQASRVYSIGGVITAIRP